MKKNREKPRAELAEKQGFSFRRGIVVTSILIFLSLRFFVDGMSYPGFNLFWNVCFFALIIAQLLAERLKNSYGREETLLFLFFLFSAISSGTATIKGTGIVSNTQILAYWCIIILIARNFTVKNKRIAFHIILFAGFFITLYGIYQYFWGLEQTRQYVYSNPGLLRSMSPTHLNRLTSNRVFSTFVYPNVFASFLLFLIPLSFFPIFSGEKIQLRIFCLLVFLLSLYNLFLTSSFGGFFVFLFIAQTMLLSLVMGNSKKFKTVLACILLFEMLALSGAYSAGKLPKMSSFTDRINYWKSSIGVFLEKPATGVGPENYKYYYTKYKPPGGMEAKHPHSIFFAALSETGATGTFFLFAFLAALSARLFKGSGASSFSRGLPFSFLAFFMHNLVDFNFINPSVAVLFFISTGLDANIRKHNTHQPESLPQRASEHKGFQSASSSLTKTLNCLIIITVIFTVLGYARYILSEKMLINAQKEKNISNVFSYLEKAERMYPCNFEVYNAKGDIFFRFYTVTREPVYKKAAEDSYRTALLLNPRFVSVYRKLSFLYEDSGETESAEQMHMKTLEIYPNKKQYNIETAVFYKKNGNEEDFERYYRLSENLPAATEEEMAAVDEYKKWIESQK